MIRFVSRKSGFAVVVTVEARGEFPRQSWVLLTKKGRLIPFSEDASEWVRNNLARFSFFERSPRVGDRKVGLAERVGDRMVFIELEPIRDHSWPIAAINDVFHKLLELAGAHSKAHLIGEVGDIPDRYIHGTAADVVDDVRDRFKRPLRIFANLLGYTG